MYEGQLVGQGGVYGIGQQIVKNIAAPSAGGGLSTVFGGYDRFRLVFCRFLVTTDGTAGNRFVSVQYLQDGSNVMAEDSAAVTVAPSTTNQAFSGRVGFGSGEWNTGTTVNLGVGGIWLEAGATIKINVTNEGAADTLTSIVFVYDTFLKPSQRMGGSLRDDEFEPAPAGYAG